MPAKYTFGCTISLTKKEDSRATDKQLAIIVLNELRSAIRKIEAADFEINNINPILFQQEK